MKHLNVKIKRSGTRILVLAFGFLLATAGNGWGQCVNVDLQAVSIDPSSPVISTSGTAQLFVVMKNNGPCPIPIGDAKFTVTFSDQYLQPAIPLNVVDLCVPARWTNTNITQAGGFYNLTFVNTAGVIPVGGADCPLQFNIGGRNIVSPGPVLVTLGSSLTAFATTGDVNATNQNASTNVVVSMVAPVTLADFTATASSCNGILDWRTTSEDNVAKFEIQYSTTATNFTTVGTVLAKNNPSGATYKYANDQGTARGYYRLKTVDKDGNFSYSRIVAIDTKCSGKKTITLYPNPLAANQNLTVIASGYEGTVKGELVGMSGQVIRTYNLKNGSNVLPVDNVAQATYMLRVSDASGDTESFRVVIMK